MISAVSRIVERAWPLILVGWIAALIVVWAVAPPWEQVVRHDDDEFFRSAVPSKQGDELFDRAFPAERRESRVVMVISREDRGGLSDEDKSFVKSALKPRLEQIAHSKPGSSIANIRALDDPESGPLMNSDDGKATLVLLDLKHGPLDPANSPAVTAIRNAISDLERNGSVPEGLAIQLTGSAVLGLDVARAEIQSAEATKLWTIGLVVTLLLIIYRAPFLVLIPLATVFIAVEIAVKSLQLLGEAGLIKLFEGVQVYVIILGYGAGIDYCLFLIARYREELACGTAPAKAPAAAVAKVGAPIGASAATVICGIGMMAFASFGKIHEAGIVIPLSLVTVLLASMTFTPSLLRLTGRLAFWPRSPVAVDKEMTGIPGASSTTRIGWRHRLLSDDRWKSVGGVVMRRPATIWLASAAILAPLAALAVVSYDHRDYGIIENLPPQSLGIAGTAELKKHFPQGTLGTITVLVENEQIDFRKPASRPATKALADFLVEHQHDLGLADIRTVDIPLGITEVVRKSNAYLNDPSPQVQEIVRSRALPYYVTHVEDLHGHVMRMELVTADDPLSTAAIGRLDEMESKIRAGIRGGPEQQSRLYFVGSTARLRDLKAVTEHDQRLIGFLVPLIVFVVLLLLFRSLVISIYLIVSVVFSYLVTMGATSIVFWAHDSNGFVGLDWRTPLFLFTILVAVGEDYNIFLLTRIREEQKLLGPVPGIAAGLARTGAIISSCGLIMAGTFGSLMAGKLPELKQMGFALAFGVLLDTLVIRTIIVPAFLVLYESGRLNFFRRSRTLQPSVRGMVSGLSAPS